MTIPQGFLYDQNSGLYYKETAATDPNGTPVRRILWFDPNTGATTEHFYPMPDQPMTATAAMPQSEPFASPIVEPIQQPTVPPVQPSQPPQTQPQTPPKKKGKGCLIAALIAGGLGLLGIIGVVLVAVVLFGGMNSMMGDVQGTLSSLLESEDIVAVQQSQLPATEVLDSNLDISAITVNVGVEEGVDGEYATLLFHGLSEDLWTKDYTALAEGQTVGTVLQDLSLIVDDQTMLSFSVFAGAPDEDGNPTFEKTMATWYYDAHADQYLYLETLLEGYMSDSFFQMHMPYGYRDLIDASEEITLSYYDGVTHQSRVLESDDLHFTH